MSGEDLALLKQIGAWLIPCAGVVWGLVKSGIKIWFDKQHKFEELKDTLEKERIAHNSEVAADLRDRQSELSDSYSHISQIINQFRQEMSDMKDVLTDVRLRLQDFEHLIQVMKTNNERGLNVILATLKIHQTQIQKIYGSVTVLGKKGET